MKEHKQQLQLPGSVVSLIDINRICREMDGIIDFMHQASIREPGSSMALPKMTKAFDELVSINNLNLLHDEDRKQLKHFLDSIQRRAPRLHMSFSVDPSTLFLQRLIEYVRKALHPYALVQVGLQPSIGAGCVLRTTNKVFDLSLREDFKKKRSLLMQYVAKLESDQPQQPAATSTPDTEVAQQAAPETTDAHPATTEATALTDAQPEEAA